MQETTPDSVRLDGWIGETATKFGLASGVLGTIAWCALVTYALLRLLG